MELRPRPVFAACFVRHPRVLSRLDVYELPALHIGLERTRQFIPGCHWARFWRPAAFESPYNSYRLEEKDDAMVLTAMEKIAARNVDTSSQMQWHCVCLIPKRLLSLAKRPISAKCRAHFEFVPKCSP